MKRYSTISRQLALLAITALIGGSIYLGLTPSRQFPNKITAQLQSTFSLLCTNVSSLPLLFQKGYVLAYQREVPGIITLVDVNGNVVWSYRSENAGFKMVSFTRNHTFLCITGTQDNDIGYGNAIIELSLHGDTLLYLKKGQKDFKQFIHHEIFLNVKDQIVTLTREERIFDLSKTGGSKNDTVVGDGVLVLNKSGQQIWKWTVFNTLNPLNDKEILKHKKDWMHANSISLDRDGNYLVSFYNNGQVWKINSITGDVIWKFGKDGDFEIPYNTIFHHAHAAHINNKGWLMLFDNGADKKRSRSLAFAIDTISKRAEPIIDSWIPPSMYSDRMGSSYLVGDTTLLVCLSRHKTICLTNLAGDFLWKLTNKDMMSYRAEFIPGEKLTPYLNK
jgi:arylsulfate sulfotransferase